VVNTVSPAHSWWSAATLGRPFESPGLVRGALPGVMAFSNHGKAGSRFHPNGVKSTPWQTQKISRIGQHVQGVRRPPPHKEEVKCLKIGERAQTLTVKQPSRHQEAGGQWDVQENPWSRSSQAVGSHHQAPFGSDSLGRVDLRSERERKEQKNGQDTLRWDRQRSHRVGDPHGAGPAAPAPPPIAPPEAIAMDAARREVRRRAERDHRQGITEPPQREPGPRTEKGLRAEALARMRQEHGAGGGGGGGGGGGRGGGGSGAEGKEFYKPGDWYTPSGPTQKQKLEGAVAELCRRTPGLTQMDALEKIGAQMDAALNRPNAVAAQHFKMAHHGPANAARV
jgi:hypothetical protein